jgi:hypothetical protein
VPYINPDCLSSLELFVLNFVLQLRGNKSQHILAATEKTLASGIIYASLAGIISKCFQINRIRSSYLSLVEAF